jgi:hypothetical protein
VVTLPLCNGADDESLKDLEINVVEFAKTEASPAHLVLPELRQKLLLPRELATR